MAPQDYENLAELRYLGRKFLRFSKDLLRARAGLTSEQYEALLAIKASQSKGDLTISELSERLQVKHHSAINIVDRLSDAKLITRERSERDRRERCLKLTAKGNVLIEEIAAVHYAELSGRAEEMIRTLQRIKR